ncbi:MAG: hypothetical protein FJ088_11865, partial [Deltaproteobacteria bacterium]|nr:hypothetical protein [Deltaproteobacteria bacterium]
MKRLFLLLIFFTACFMIFTYPLATDPAGSFITDGGDGPLFVWNIYNFSENARELRNPYRTDRIFHPSGSSLIMHTYSPVYGIFGLFTRNPVFALNLALFLSFIFSALGSFYLSRHYLKNDLLSALSGMVFAFAPYKLSHVREHYNLMLTATIPFFVLLFVKSFRNSGGVPALPDKKHAAIAALLLSVTIFSEYYYAAYLLVFAALYLIYLFSCRQETSP